MKSPFDHETPPYFFALEYACTDAGTNAFSYETGSGQATSPFPRGPCVPRSGGRAEGFGATAVSVPIPPGGILQSRRSIGIGSPKNHNTK